MNPTYQVIRGGRVSNDQCWLNLAVQRIDSYAGFGLKAAVHISDPRVRLGSCVTSTAGPNGGAQLYER